MSRPVNFTFSEYTLMSFDEEELNLFDTDGDKDSDIYPDIFNEPKFSQSFPHSNLEVDKEIANC